MDLNSSINTIWVVFPRTGVGGTRGRIETARGGVGRGPAMSGTERCEMNGSVRAMAKPNEAAAYIEQSAAGLGDLAKRSGMEFLAYLLEMVRLEAASCVLAQPKAEAAAPPPPAR